MEEDKDSRQKWDFEQDVRYLGEVIDEGNTTLKSVSEKKRHCGGELPIRN